MCHLPAKICSIYDDSSDRGFCKEALLTAPNVLRLYVILVM
jgi:hypothetical protein